MHNLGIVNSRMTIDFVADSPIRFWEQTDMHLGRHTVRDDRLNPNDMLQTDSRPLMLAPSLRKLDGRVGHFQIRDPR
ncbi:hypothetical protein D3C72_1025090 [compost metagenome]